MQANLKRSAAVLGTLLFTLAPAITHAATQQEWLQTQLQLTDGYTSEASTPALKKSDGNTSRTDTKAPRGADTHAATQQEWLQTQLRLTNG